MSRHTVTRQTVVDRTDPDTAIYFAETPTVMINRLLPLVPTDATIATYVGNHFGRRVDVSRVAALRARMVTENLKANPDSPYSALGEPIGGTPEDKARREDAAEGSLRLIEALRAAKRGSAK